MSLRSLARVLLVMLTIVAGLSSTPQTAAAISAAKLHVYDLTNGGTEVPLYNDPTYGPTYPLTINHRYKFIVDGGFLYEYMRLRLGSSTAPNPFSNISWGATEYATLFPCVYDSTFIMVTCDTTPSEQGNQIQAVWIIATITTPLASPGIRGFWFTRQTGQPGSGNITFYYHT